MEGIRRALSARRLGHDGAHSYANHHVHAAWAVAQRSMDRRNLPKWMAVLLGPILRDEAVVPLCYWTIVAPTDDDTGTFWSFGRTTKRYSN